MKALSSLLLLCAVSLSSLLSPEVSLAGHKCCSMTCGHGAVAWIPTYGIVCSSFGTPISFVSPCTTNVAPTGQTCLVVHCAAGACVTISGCPTYSCGITRTYCIPMVEAQREISVVATIKDSNGKELSQTVPVKLVQGQTVAVTLECKPSDKSDPPKPKEKVEPQSESSTALLKKISDDVAALTKKIDTLEDRVKDLEGKKRKKKK